MEILFARIFSEVELYFEKIDLSKPDYERISLNRGRSKGITNYREFTEASARPTPGNFNEFPRDARVKNLYAYPGT